MGWGLCIATGTPWLGREVLRGPAAYIAGEGAFGIGQRVKAWKHFHSFRGNSGVKWFDEALVLQDSNNLQELQTAFAEDFAQPPVLVVIDTLSRCSGGADENSNSDMARIIAAADAIQQRYHCTVLIVHHAGKDSDRGPRGASSLIGNTETIIEVARTDAGLRVVCYKQKDAPKFEPFSLKFQLVQYASEAGQSSAVLIHDSEQHQPALRQSEAVMLAQLTQAGKPLMYNEWRQAGLEVGLKERTDELAIKNLLNARRVERKHKRYVLMQEGEPEKEGGEDYTQLERENAAD